jgi:Bromodomain
MLFNKVDVSCCKVLIKDEKVLIKLRRQKIEPHDWHALFGKNGDEEIEAKISESQEKSKVCQYSSTRVLHILISQQFLALEYYDLSEKAKEARTPAISWNNGRMEKPPQSLLLKILAELRAMQYTDSLLKLSEAAMRPFEKPVDVNVYRDYLQIVRVPICLEDVDVDVDGESDVDVERKGKNDQYDTLEDFEHYVHSFRFSFQELRSIQRTKKVRTYMCLPWQSTEPEFSENCFFRKRRPMKTQKRLLTRSKPLPQHLQQNNHRRRQRQRLSQRLHKQDLVLLSDRRQM